MPDVGPVVARSITEFFGERHNHEVVLQLLAAGVTFEQTAARAIDPASPVFGKTFVLTGALPTLTRDEAAQKIRDRGGKVLRRFVVKIDARWQGEKGVLEEHFDWSDGKTEFRRWEIEKDGDHYRGTAGDVVGTAAGEAAGNALQWRYTLALPVGERIWHVQFDDWMYLLDDKVMLNKAAMSKWGIFLGEVTLSFTRRGV